MQDTLGSKKSSLDKHFQSSTSRAKNDASEQLWRNEDGDSVCGGKSRGSGTCGQRQPPNYNELSLTEAIEQPGQSLMQPDRDVYKLSKKSVETVQEVVTEFILFVTSEACERAMHENRSTIQSADILEALKSLGFDTYCHYVKLYNDKYIETMKQHKKQWNEESGNDNN